jgi:Ankyrin repeats (3 copies)
MKHWRIWGVALWTAIMLASPAAQAVTLEEELAYRVRFSRADDVLLLISKGADPNTVNEVGLPMVSVAALRTDADAIPVMRALLQKGADINRGGSSNQYPIIVAARENNVPMMEFLVKEAKADYTVRDLNGMLPLQIAEYYDNQDAADLVRDLTEELIAKDRERTSLHRRDQLIEDLGHKLCEQHYMYYYYISKQDKHPQDVVDAEIMRYREEVGNIMGDLYAVFKMPLSTQTSILKYIQPILTAELDAMISNRERRRRGIGTKKDLKERCGRIANQWHESYLKAQEAMEAREPW